MIWILTVWNIIMTVALIALWNMIAKWLLVVEEQGVHLTAVNKLDRARAKEIAQLRRMVLSEHYDT